MALFRSYVKIGTFFSVLFLLVVMGPPLAVGKNFTGETVRWTLTKAKVVASAANTVTREGNLTMGYTVEAKATSDNAPIKKALFRAELTSFSPQKNMVRQKMNTWYITGKWEIIEENADKKKLKLKHSDKAIRGFIRAQLPFNPAVSKGTFEANTEMPLTLVGDFWGKANGFFFGNEKFEGDIELTFERWQKVR